MSQTRNRVPAIFVMGVVIVTSIVYLVLGYGLEVTFGAVGSLVGSIALILYIQDATAVEPVIVQTTVRIMDKPNEYIIECFVSNEGGGKARNCTAVVKSNGNVVSNLSHVPVDSSLGRIGITWPSNVLFDLYARRPIWVKGYITNSPPGTFVQVVLSAAGKEYTSPAFDLPASPKVQSKQTKARSLPAPTGVQSQTGPAPAN